MSKKNFIQWLRERIFGKSGSNTEATKQTEQETEATERMRRGQRQIVVVMILSAMIILFGAFSGGFSKDAWLAAMSCLLIASGCSILGVFGGFVFGIPKSAVGPVTSNGSGAHNGSGAGSIVVGKTPPSNLEEIAEWLSKLLLGAGLTQVDDISRRLITAGTTIGKLPGIRDVADVGNTGVGNVVFGVGLILVYIVGGFLIGFLWARLNLGKALKEADAEKLEKALEKAEQAEIKAESAKEAVEKASNVVPAEAAKAALSITEFGVGAASRFEAKLESMTTEAKVIPFDQIVPGNIPNDPWKGVFGGKSVVNGRELKAEVKEDSTDSDYYSIHLEVVSTDSSKPLGDAVRFFLHDSFKNDKPIVPVKDGRATLDLYSYGAFTVGAYVDGGATLLELDLATLPDAPSRFKEN